MPKYSNLQGKYSPIFPKTPACYGFTIISEDYSRTQEPHFFTNMPQTCKKTIAAARIV